MKLTVEHKFSLTVYLWGAITGIVSGLLAYYNEAGWLLGFLLYLLVDRFVMAIVKELPEDIPEQRVILRKAFWGWFLFWLFFTMMSYTLVTNFQPVCYSNQSLLYKMVESGNASIKCIFAMG
ncbi:hypothetical protein [Thermococcus stetteri]|uniref:hypothetical protein n=1 Tax=Thermococcus stetteri TaxID=49900 RepID=UPI001AEB98B2|nr:hypothetical protein [Thermococcus stetteri]